MQNPKQKNEIDTSKKKERKAMATSHSYFRLDKNLQQKEHDKSMKNLPTSQDSFKCVICDRPFKSYRGLMQHARYCEYTPVTSHETEKSTLTSKENEFNPNQNDVINRTYDEQEQIATYFWGDVPSYEVEASINSMYEQIVHWRKNLFMVPSGAAGKSYIKEVTRLINSWNENSPLKSIALKAVHIMPSLLLQKPSKNSKTKDHISALNRRLELWGEGKFDELLWEALTIQRGLKTILNSCDIASISKRFANLMQRGNVNGALNLITNNMAGGILPLTDDVIKALIEKHPDPAAITDQSILEGPILNIHPSAYAEIDSSLILKMATSSKGGSGPSGMDADGWRNILVSKNFGDCGEDLRKSVATLTRKLCCSEIRDKSLEALLANRLIPLDKCPGVRPIGVGEVLRRIIGKAVMSLAKQQVMVEP